MRFLRALEFLPTPTVRSIGPSVIAFSVFALLNGLPITVFGCPASALGLAAAAGLILLLARNAPIAIERARELGAGTLLVVISLALPCAAVAAAMSLSDAQIQLLWLAAMGGHTFVLAVLSHWSTDAEMQGYPTRWRDNAAFARVAISIHVVVIAALMAASGWMIGRAALIDWVALMTLGTIAAYYLREWLVILIIWRSYD